MDFEVLATHFKKLGYTVFVEGDYPSRLLGVIKGTVGYTFHEMEWRDFMIEDQLAYINYVQNKVAKALESNSEQESSKMKIIGKTGMTFNETPEEIVIDFASELNLMVNHVQGASFIKVNDEIIVLETDSIRCVPVDGK